MAWADQQDCSVAVLISLKTFLEFPRMDIKRLTHRLLHRYRHPLDEAIISSVYWHYNVLA